MKKNTKLVFSNPEFIDNIGEIPTIPGTGSGGLTWQSIGDGLYAVTMPDGSVVIVDKFGTIVE